MKKFLFTLMIFIFIGPFLVCDVPTWNPDYYVITGLPAPLDGSNVLPDPTKTYGFKFDLANLPAITVDTSRSITVVACKNATDTSTGGCSASVPFTFTQNYIGSGITKIKIVK